MTYHPYDDTHWEDLDAEEKKARHKENNDSVQLRFVARSQVLARRHEKNGNQKKAQQHLAAASLFSACGTNAEYRHDDNSVVDEQAHDGTTQVAKRRLYCRHPLCHVCHGRAHRSRAHAASVIGDAEAREAKLLQLAIQTPRPYSRATVAETHAHAEALARQWSSSPSWSAWARASSMSLEPTPSSVADAHSLHFHVHALLELHEGHGDGIPADVREAIEATGASIATGFSLVDDGTRFHRYMVKGSNGKGMVSPFLRASSAVIDGMLELVAARACFHFFTGAWSTPSLTKKKVSPSSRKVKKPTTKNEAVDAIAARVRVPTVVVTKDMAEVVPGLPVTLVTTDTRGRRRREIGWAIAPVVGDDVEAALDVNGTNDDNEHENENVA